MSQTHTTGVAGKTGRSLSSFAEAENQHSLHKLNPGTMPGSTVASCLPANAGRDLGLVEMHVCLARLWMQNDSILNPHQSVYSYRNPTTGIESPNCQSCRQHSSQIKSSLQISSVNLHADHKVEQSIL